LSVACSLVGVMFVLNQPQDKDSNAKIVAYFADHAHRVNSIVGFFVFLAGIPLLLAFLAALRERLLAAEGQPGPVHALAFGAGRPLNARKQHSMFHARNALTLAGLAFATWETIDIFLISFPAAAAVFAVLFLASTLWYWRRHSVRAAVALMLLFAFEAAVAPTLNAMTVTRVADFALALTGVALATTVVAARRRTRGARPVAA